MKDMSLFWFLLLLGSTLPSTLIALTPAALLNKAQGVVQKGLDVTNFGLGSFSRSLSVSNAMKSLKRENSWKAKETLNQAIVTLAVLDIGGGALVPLTDHIIDTVTKHESFEATMEAWGVYNQQMKNKLAGDWIRLTDDEVKAFLSSEKAKVMRAFDSDVGNLPRNSRVLKHLNKAKRWFRVKTVGQVLGPLFDAVSIGVNSWALHTVLRDCEDDSSSCNLGSVAAATLSIASGCVGVLTFFASLAGLSVLGPVGAAISVLLAIGATLVELIYKPPVDQDVQRLIKEKMMDEMQRYSRFQLYTVTKFLADNDIDRDDLYVINQGHLPKWFIYFDAEDNTMPVTMKFGIFTGMRPRKKEEIEGQCSEPVSGPPTTPSGPVKPNVHTCPYLVEGIKLIDSYAFYGFTKNARSYAKEGEQGTPPSDPPYRGSMVLVNTDQVQESVLRALTNDVDLNRKLRGLRLRFDLKDNHAAHDDLLAIGKMKNLDRGEAIFVRMGGGNDALNIDGMLGEFTTDFENILDADLGYPGHNTLSFLGISDDSEIRGINYDASDGTLQFYHGSNRDLHPVGKVTNVEILVASPFDDHIKLAASHKGENGLDLTVFKFKGKATYEIDLALLGDERAFKIIDNSDNDEQQSCENHKPVLLINNFGDDAVANDVLYVGKLIKVYGARSTKASKGLKHRKGYAKRKDHVSKSSHHHIKRTSGECQGENADGSHPKGGGEGKPLLVTVNIISKCPFEIRALTRTGQCMMSPRQISEVDLMFFGGKAFISDFSQDYTGTDQADVCTLKCPNQPVRGSTLIHLGRGSHDAVVLRNDLFLDPCGIDGDDTSLTLTKVPRTTNTWELVIREKEESKWVGNGATHQIKSVEKILNEYGEVVVDLANAQQDEIDLFDAYTEVTLRNLARLAEETQSEEIKNDLLKCLENANENDEEIANMCKVQ